MKTLTHSGKLIEVKKPDPELITLIDIAAGLSRQFRFNSLTVLPYTVAQHSVIVSRICKNPKAQLLALLHDASEAYLHDIPTPIKNALPDYQRLEDKWMKAIHQAILWDEFYENLDEPETLESEWRDADKLALAHEVSTIAYHKEAFGIELIPEILQIQELREHHILSPDDAFVVYMTRFNDVLQLLK